jgi:hypothetical protein
MPRHCRNCGGEGHEIRTCNDPYLQESRKEFYKKIHRREPLPNIVENAKSIPIEKMRLITYKTEKGKVSKISSLKESEQTYYEKLEKYIKKEYEKQEEGLKRIVILKILHHRTLLNALPLVSIHSMYQNYITQIATEERNEYVMRRIARLTIYPSEEIFLLRDITETTTWESVFLSDITHLYQLIETRTSEGMSYEMMTRFLGFLLLVEDEQATRTKPTTKPLEYNFIKRIQTETETIDCPICMENISTPDISEVNCGHKFCRSCIRQTIHRHAKDKRCGCPMCRTPIEKIVRKYIKTD